MHTQCLLQSRVLDDNISVHDAVNELVEMVVRLILVWDGSMMDALHLKPLLHFL